MIIGFIFEYPQYVIIVGCQVIIVVKRAALHFLYLVQKADYPIPEVYKKSFLWYIDVPGLSFVIAEKCPGKC